MGTNSSFRRDLLVSLGGFDEEFEYFLDESDVCCRIIDRGWVVRELDDGFVYHKFLPSAIRTPDRVVKSYFSVIKNSVYFALKHALPYYSFHTVCDRLLEVVENYRRQRRWVVENGLLTPDYLDRFEEDVNAGFDAGWHAHVTHGPRYPACGVFDAPSSLRRFAIRWPHQNRLTIVLLSQEWSPQPFGGIGRLVATLAQGLADEGHVVHVLTRGEGHDRVDLDGGVWVHRIVARPHTLPAGLSAPARIWDYAASIFDEVKRIAAHRHVDVVHSPNWDSEGSRCCWAEASKPSSLCTSIEDRARPRFQYSRS